MSVSRQTASPSRVCRLAPMGRARALTPPLGQWPAGWQRHTLMVSVLVLDKAGDPLSVTTTGRRYWVWSRRVKELLRATTPAVLSGKSEGGCQGSCDVTSNQRSPLIKVDSRSGDQGKGLS